MRSVSEDQVLQEARKKGIEEMLGEMTQHFPERDPADGSNKIDDVMFLGSSATQLVALWALVTMELVAPYAVVVMHLQE